MLLLIRRVLAGRNCYYLFPACEDRLRIAGTGLLMHTTHCNFDHDFFDQQDYGSRKDTKAAKFGYGRISKFLECFVSLRKTENDA